MITLGIVFDMDGVLVDSMSCHRQAFLETLEPFDFSPFHYPDFAGWKTTEVFQKLLPGAHSSVIEACARRKSERARQLLAEKPELFTACVPVVTQLAASFPLALASSGSRKSVETFLNRSGLRSLFGSVVCGDDVARAKPHPEIFQRAIRELDLEPAHCIVVEDSDSGIEAAQAAGAIACRFGPGCMIETLEQLPTFVANIRHKLDRRDSGGGSRYPACV